MSRAAPDEKCGVFILSHPIVKCGGELVFGDVCNGKAVSLCAERLDRVHVVARCRSAQALRADSIRLSAIGASHTLELPNYHGTDWVGMSRALRLLASPAVIRRVVEVIKDATFVYVEGSSLEVYPAAYAARKAGKRLILEMRGDTLFNSSYMKYRFGWAGVVYAKFARAGFRYVLNAAVGGLYVADHLRKRYPLRNGRSCVVSDVNLVPGIWAEPCRPASPAREYLYVGHLEKVKRVDLLLHALSKAGPSLPADWFLTVVGDGPARAELEKLVRELNIETHVGFRGVIAWGETLFDLYHRSHLLLLSSLTEGASRALLEGMAAGLPILSSAVGNAPELLHECMIVRGWSVDQWADKVAKTVKNLPLLGEMAALNHERVKAFAPTLTESKRRDFFWRAIDEGWCNYAGN